MIFCGILFAGELDLWGDVVGDQVDDLARGVKDMKLNLVNLACAAKWM